MANIDFINAVLMRIMLYLSSEVSCLVLTQIRPLPCTYWSSTQIRILMITIITSDNNYSIFIL